MKQRIKRLNQAWKLMNKSISIIESVFNEDNDISYFVWKLRKVNDQLQSKIQQKIEKEEVEKEYQNIIKTLKKDKQ